MSYEQFTLPSGDVVCTGMLRSTNDAPPLLRAFPQNMLMDDKDIERRLNARSIKDMRAARQFRMRNQGGIGSCCPVSVVSCFEQLQEETGRPHTPLQPEHLYSAINGGRDSGATLRAAMNRMVTHGCASHESGLVPYQSYNRRSIRDVAAADRDGLRFRFHEPFALPKDFKTYCRAVASAICLGMPVEFAWHVTSATMRLNNGFVSVGRGPGNHASYLHWAKWVGGEELIVGDIANSWGPSANQVYGRTTGGWGDNGYGLCRMSDIFPTQAYHDHFVPTMIIDDPQEKR